MVRGAFRHPGGFIDPDALQPGGHGSGAQDEVDAPALVGGETVGEEIPERIVARPLFFFTEQVDPQSFRGVFIGLAGLGVEADVLGVVFGVPEVDLGGGHVQVPQPKSGLGGFDGFGEIFFEPGEIGQLHLELVGIRRESLRHVGVDDEHLAAPGRDEPGLVVGVEGVQPQDRLLQRLFGDQRDPVIALLSPTQNVPTRFFERVTGEQVIRHFRLLEGQHVRLFAREPVQDDGEPDADGVGVERGDFERHGGTSVMIFSRILPGMS